MRLDAERLIAGALILAGCAWAIFNLVSPPPRFALPERAPLEAGPVPDAATLQALADRLQPPAAAPAPAPVRDPSTPADVRLVGLVESDTGWVALLALSGETVTATPGDRVGRYRLIGVDARSVVLEGEGERLRLELDS